MAGPVRVHEALPREASSPRLARALVARALGSAGHDEATVGIARLLTSELATNAVRHGRGASFAVDVEAGPSGATVRVGDEAPWPPAPAPPDEGGLREGGWGLELVARLSRTWGVEPHEGGKVVWFTLGGGPPER